MPSQPAAAARNADSAERRPSPLGRRTLIAAAKWLMIVGVFSALFYNIRDEHVFQRLLREPKHWGMLAAAQVLVVAAMSLNYVRWYVLVRALDLNFRMADAFRLGSLGLLFSQVMPSSVGGDLLKALFVAREQHGKRTEAVASVVADRIVGVYGMMLVASFGYYFGARGMAVGETVHALGRAILVVAAIGTIGIGLLMTPALTGPRVSEWAEKLPLVGSMAHRLIQTAAAYRRSRGWLLCGIAAACCTHVMFVTAFWCIGRGLPVSAPDLATMFVVAPLSNVAGAIPLLPGGLGQLEAAMAYLFQEVGSAAGDGAFVALTYRLMTYVMAALGAVYYLSARRVVDEVLHEAEEFADDGGAAEA